MNINWFTLSAQIVNFLVLVLLLRHFLYRRIINAMDAREKRIRDTMAEAERRRAEAEQKAEDYVSRTKELAAHKADFFAAAQEEAVRRRNELFDQARREVNGTRQRWLEAFEQEKEAVSREFRARLGRETVKLSRKVLADLAGRPMEEDIIDTFLARLAALPRRPLSR